MPSVLSLWEAVAKGKQGFAWSGPGWEYRKVWDALLVLSTQQKSTKNPSKECAVFPELIPFRTDGEGPDCP